MIDSAATAAEIAVADIGGTHARFAIARLNAAAPPRLTCSARLLPLQTGIANDSHRSCRPAGAVKPTAR